MTADTRFTRSPSTRAMKASDLQSASAVSASAPLKCHLPVPTLKRMKETVAKPPSTSTSSNSSSGKRGLNGGKAISTGTILQGTKDAPAHARDSFSESSTETIDTEASSELSVDCVEPDETKRIIDMTEASLFIPEFQSKDLDVVDSNLAVNWFNVDCNEFDDFLNTKADQNPHMPGSEKQNSLSAAAEAIVTPNSILESINNGYIVDEFGGAIGMVNTTNTPLQQNKKCQDGKAVVDELTNVKTPDVIEYQCEGKDNSRKYEDGSTLPEKSERKGEVKLPCANLMRQTGHEIDALTSWRSIKILIPSSVLVMFIVLFCVDHLVEDELRMLPSPT